MKVVQIDARRSDLYYLIDVKECRVIAQLCTDEPISVSKILKNECLLKKYKNMDSLFILYNNHIYNSQNNIII
jgi:hypothetical protein